MSIPDFVKFALYVPKEGDVYHTPAPNTAADPEPVNLNAISYYASLGCKPRQIGPLVGTTHQAIWNNNRMKQAYEDGAAYHVLFHRFNLHQNSLDKPQISESSLARAVGSAEQDCADGYDPAEQRVVDAAPTKIELVVTRNEGADRAEIEAELQRVINDADDKK